MLLDKNIFINLDSFSSSSRTRASKFLLSRFPPTTDLSGMSRSIKDMGEIITLSPIVIPGATTDGPAIKHFLPILVFLNVIPFLVLLPVLPAKAWR